MDAPLLVVVDMQRVFAEPDSPWYVPGFASLTRPIERLREAFGGRQIFTRFTVPAEPEGSWREYYRTWEFIRSPQAAPLLELAPPWSDLDFPLLDKTTFSAYGPELHRLAGAAQTLVLCGVSTECCVLSTAIDAADAGLTVRIVADACASVDNATHQSALQVAKMGFAPMIEINSVDEELARDADSTS